MDIPQSLPLISNVSIGLVGFSGLIVTFRTNSGPLTKIERYRLQVLLSLSLGALFISFVPELLNGLGFVTAWVWRAACGFLAFYSALFLIWWVAESLHIRRPHPELFQWLTFGRMAALHLAVIALELTVLWGWQEEIVPAIFTAGLIWFLLHAAQQFARMLFVPVRPD